VDGLLLHLHVDAIISNKIWKFAKTGSVCGGNCPDGTCLKCICGQSKQIISIDDWCKKSSLWDVNCCKCIVTRINGGNAHYTHYIPSTIPPYIGNYITGILPVGGTQSETEQSCDS